MNENIKELLVKLSEDEAALAKLKAVKSPDEAYEFVSSIQGGFTKEEFVEAMGKIRTATESGELTDEEVSAAAGGMDTTVATIISTISRTAAFVGTSV